MSEPWENMNRDKRHHVGAEEFRRAAIGMFRELENELAGAEDIHAQMGLLADFALEGLVLEDRKRLDKIFKLLAEIVSNLDLDDDIKTALHVSFLSKADFDNHEFGTTAWQLVPPSLREHLQQTY